RGGRRAACAEAGASSCTGARRRGRSAARSPTKGRTGARRAPSLEHDIARLGRVARAMQAQALEPERLAQRERLAGEVPRAELVEAEHAPPDEVRADRLEARPGRLEEVEVEVRERDHRLRSLF